jgi:hypothetical protein
MDNTKSTALLLASCALGLGFAAQSTLADDDDHHRVRATLSGFSEVHFGGGPPATLVGAISTGARGTFRATIDKGGQSISYRLSYSGLEGTVTQAHIHFGQAHTVGGIIVWLCQTAAPFVDPAGKAPTCPQAGTVTGTIGPDQVLALPAQGIAPTTPAAERFDELVRAIRAGATYANVHSSAFGPGEVRGQIGDRDD